MPSSLCRDDPLLRRFVRMDADASPAASAEAGAVPSILLPHVGAEEFVAWEEKKNIFPLLAKLKREKFFIIGVEQDKNSVDYKKIKIKNKNVFIVGAEVTGVPKNILEKCDVVAEIPMHGQKESLNVSVACGIALFRILDL